MSNMSNDSSDQMFVDKQEDDFSDDEDDPKNKFISDMDRIKNFDKKIKKSRESNAKIVAKSQNFPNGLPPKNEQIT